MKVILIVQFHGWTFGLLHMRNVCLALCTGQRMYRHEGVMERWSGNRLTNYGNGHNV